MTDSTTIRLSASADGSSMLMPPLRMRVVSGPSTGAVFAASGDRFVIGSDEKAQLILQDRTVSRFHCEIGVEDGRVAIRDLGSRNGTRVDGVSIVHAYLEPGARISIGQTELTFELGTEPVAIPLSGGERFGSMVGRASITRAAFAILERAAQSDATVLLFGETGTGKEEAAESIHAASGRSAGPFIVVDCAAIPPQLLESELFGHEKGAFTGASEARAGAFEAANGGTIFLDEIGELGAELQPKLLRVLEKRHSKRVGATQYEAIDVRVIAATNRDLKSEVNARRFRSDLYYRLAVLEVRLPPLRERTDDIPILIEHLLRSLGAEQRGEADLLRNALPDLMRHSWPGNVRELRNYVERCLALSAAPPLALEESERPTTLKGARDRAKLEFEKKYLEDLLEEHGGVVARAARAAGVDRKHFYRLLWRHGLR
jgi:two-component system, NtrC family, response regulator GlrR